MFEGNIMTEELAMISADVQEELIAKLTSHIESIAQEACKTVAEESIIELAIQAIQVVIDEVDVPAQVKQLLSQQGEEWLTDQEEGLGTQLSAQLDFHIPNNGDTVFE